MKVPAPLVPSISRSPESAQNPSSTDPKEGDKAVAPPSSEETTTAADTSLQTEAEDEQDEGGDDKAGENADEEDDEDKNEDDVDEDDGFANASDHEPAVIDHTAFDDEEEEEVVASEPTSYKTTTLAGTKIEAPVPNITCKTSAVQADQRKTQSTSVSKSTSSTPNATSKPTSPSTVELPDNFFKAQASLQRMTPSITNLMMAAMKHNCVVEDVFPKAHRLAAQAYALKLEMDKIGEGISVAVASIGLMERDLGWLGEEVKKMGSVWK